MRQYTQKLLKPIFARKDYLGVQVKDPLFFSLLMEYDKALSAHKKQQNKVIKRHIFNSAAAEMA